jgi:DNA-binding transcriptional ArsR family regulator
MDDLTTAAVAKALAHPARLHILQLLAREPECRGAELFAELPLAQSTVSQHLAILQDAGVVTSHAVGQGRVYCVAPEVLRTFSAEITALVADVTACSIDSEECR